jgi:hypothetical protein
MPIILPAGFAAAPLLRAEGIEVLHRPTWGSSTLRVGLLNLMPDKTGTEMQFARFLKSAGELANAVWPEFESRAFIEGSARTALISLLSFSTMSGGVFFGAAIPAHELAS